MIARRFRIKFAQLVDSKVARVLDHLSPHHMFLGIFLKNIVAGSFNASLLGRKRPPPLSPLGIFMKFPIRFGVRGNKVFWIMIVKFFFGLFRGNCSYRR